MTIWPRQWGCPFFYYRLIVMNTTIFARQCIYRRGSRSMWITKFVFLEVTLGGYSSDSLTIPRCKIGTRPPGNSELNHCMRIIACKREQSVVALKPMGRVNWSPKQSSLVKLIYTKSNIFGIIIYDIYYCQNDPLENPSTTNLHRGCNYFTY